MFIFNRTDPTNKLPHAESFPDQIRKWFQFYFSEQGIIFCREHRGKEWVCQQIGFVDERAALEKKVQQMASDQPPEKLLVDVLKARLGAVGVDTKGLRKPELVQLFKNVFKK